LEKYEEVCCCLAATPGATLALMLLSGRGVPSQPPLSANNINLIFVASEDQAHNVPGDINPK